MDKEEIRFLCKSLFDTYYSKFQKEFDSENLIMEKVHKNNQVTFKDITKSDVVEELVSVLTSKQLGNKILEINIKTIKGKNILPLKITNNG